MNIKGEERRGRRGEGRRGEEREKRRWNEKGGGQDYGYIQSR